MVRVTTNVIVNKLLIHGLDDVCGHSITKIPFNHLTVHSVTLLIIHRTTVPWNKWTLLSRAEGESHGLATWLTFNTHPLVFVYMQHACRTQCLRLRWAAIVWQLTDCWAAAESASRPPPTGRPRLKKLSVYSPGGKHSDDLLSGSHMTGGEPLSQRQSALLIAFKSSASFESFIPALFSEHLNIR
jgi:hypothetical protein